MQIRKNCVDIIRAIKTKYNQMTLPVRASLWFVICSVVQNGFSFVMISVFTRMMSTTEYGLVTVYTSWMGIVCIFTTLNLQYGSFNTAQIKFEGARDSYLSAVQWLVTLITGAAVLIYLVIPDFWDTVFNMPNGLTVVMLIHIWGQFITALWMGNKRFDYNYKPMVLVTLLSAVLVPIISVIAVANAEAKGTARILSMAAVEITIGLVLLIINQIKGKTCFNKEFWRYALGFNIPLIPYYLSQIIFNTSDRIMIDWMVGKDKAAIYGLCYSVAFLLNFIIVALNNAYVPWLYRQIKDNNGQAAGAVTKKLIVGVAVMLVMLMLISPELILFLGGREYFEAIWVIAPVSASLLFSFFSQITNNIIFYYEKKAALVKSTVVSALTNIVLNYIGIPIFGYFVAGYTTLISFIVFWIMLYFGARNVCRSEGMNEKLYIDIAFQIRFGIGFLCVAGMVTLSYLNNIVRYCIIAIIILIALIKHKKVFALVKNFLSF